MVVAELVKIFVPGRWVGAIAVPTRRGPPKPQGRSALQFGEVAPRLHLRVRRVVAVPGELVVTHLLSALSFCAGKLVPRLVLGLGEWPVALPARLSPAQCGSPGSLRRGELAP